MSNISKSGIRSEDWEVFIEWESRLTPDMEVRPNKLSPLELSDLEDELGTWLNDHQVVDGWELAPSLVNVGVTAGRLNELADSLSVEGLQAVLLWCSKYYVARDLANVIGNSSGSISSLVESVKSYSYMDQAPVQQVDVHRGLEDTLRILGHKLTSGIEVIKEFDEELPKIEVRGSELNQVWTNLIDNSVAALGDKGTITLRTSRIGPNIAIEIQDDGPGIPSDIQNRVFDPFFTTKDVGEGTGLGLDVTRRIVRERCGGEISLTSSPGETIFKVVLPVNAG